MKWVIVVSFSLACLLLAAAQMTKPDARPEDSRTLVWATDDSPARQAQIELFRQWHLKKYGETADVQIDPSNTSMTKVIVQSLAGAGPDIFCYWSLSQLERYQSSGIMLDVTEQARERGFSKEIVWEGVWPSFTLGERQYGFPLNVVSYLMFYHKDVFDKAGEPYPTKDWTWQDFLGVAQRLTFTDKEGVGHWGVLRTDGLMMAYQNGAQLYSPEGTHCALNCPEAVEAFTFARSLQGKYHVQPTTAELESQSSSGGWGGGSLNVFATKRFAMTLAGRYWYIGFEKDARQLKKQGNEASYNLGVVESPYFARRYGYGGSLCVAINKISKKKELAMRFLEYMATREFNDQINRGCDGLAPVKQYCVDEDGIGAAGTERLPGLEDSDSPSWAESMEYTHEWETSPFISPYRARKLWAEASELGNASDMTVEEMLKHLETTINAEIQVNISKDPILKDLYDQAVAKENQMAMAVAP